MKDTTLYFPHDYNARRDPAILALRMKMGAAGYGVFWFIVEALYESAGRLSTDYGALEWELHVPKADIEAVVTQFDLFYLADGGKSFGSKAVDRRLAERREKSAKAAASARQRRPASPAPKEAPKPSEGSPDAERTQSERFTNGQLERKKETKERKDAPSASDSGEGLTYHGHRLQVGGEFKGVHVESLPKDTAKKLLETGRPNKVDRKALEWWVAEKEREAGAPRESAQEAAA